MPLDVLPEVRDTAGELGVLRHESWPVELPLCGQVVDQQAALAGAGCVVPGRVKATYGTGVFVLGHAGDEVPRPAGGLLPTVAWRIDGRTEYAIDGGVFAAGAMLEWMCRELGHGRAPGRARPSSPAARTTAAARACCPALAGMGAPWWRPDARAVIAGMHGGTTRANVARAALEGIAWRVADVVAAMRETRRRATRCAWTAGSPTSRCCSSSRPTRSACRVEAAGADATVLGAAALAAVGVGRDRLARGGRRAAAGGPPVEPQQRRRAGARASTSAGRRSCSRRPSFRRPRRAPAAARPPAARRRSVGFSS